MEGEFFREDLESIYKKKAAMDDEEDMDDEELDGVT